MTTVHLKVAVRRSRTYPHTRVRLLGPRAGAQAGEVVIPLALKIDDAWFERELARVWVDVNPPPAPTAAVEGAPK